MRSAAILIVTLMAIGALGVAYPVAPVAPQNPWRRTNQGWRRLHENRVTPVTDSGLDPLLVAAFQCLTIGAIGRMTRANS